MTTEQLGMVDRLTSATAEEIYRKVLALLIRCMRTEPMSGENAHRLSTLYAIVFYDR